MNKNDLPLELVVEILSWLPVKSLVGFKCVSKSWYDLIKDPKFIKLHLDQLFERNSDTYLIGCLKPEHISIYSFRAKYQHPYYHLTELSYPKNLELVPFESKIHGSCNGLLCISTNARDWSHITFCLYNPATQTIKRLPPCVPIINSATKVLPLKVALGYDRVSDDYKVFTSVISWNSNTIEKNDERTLLYSLKSDAWEDILNPPWGSDLLLRANRTILANNSFHWMIKTIKEIKCFDFITRRYYEIPFPDVDDGCLEGEEQHFDYSPYLTVLRGQLCMVMYNLDIWILKEYGNAKSWTRIFRNLSGQLNSDEISDMWRYCCLRIGCMKDEHNIILVNCKARQLQNLLFCCDLKFEAVRKIEIPSLPENMKLMIGAEYMEPWVESLVSLHQSI